MSGGIFSTGKNGVENFPSLTVEHFPLLMNPFVENFLSKIVCFPLESIDIRVSTVFGTDFSTLGG